MEDSKKLFVRRNSWSNVFIICVLLFIAVVFAAVLLLIQAKNSKALIEPGDGFGRNTMFPFVYISDNGTLYIISDDSLKVKEIDDTVSDCVHDYENGDVYYLRENVLYKYTVSNGKRKTLASGVSSYSLSGSRSFIVLVSIDGSLKFYDGKKTVTLAENLPLSAENLYSVGKNKVVFINDLNPDTTEGIIYSADAAGKINSTGIKADCSRKFYICDNDTQILSFLGNNMTVSDLKGKVKFSGQNYINLAETEQKQLYGQENQVTEFNANISLRYFINNPEEDGTYVLCTISDGKADSIISGIESVIFYNPDTDLLLYTKKGADGLFVYKKTGSAEEKQLTCPEGTEFVFDSEKNYLYYRLPDGKLYRYNVYDVSLSSVSVSDSAGELFMYNNKNIVAYTVPETDIVSLVLDDNTVSSYNFREEKHLYGSGNTYVLLRNHGENLTSLDLVNKKGIERISSDVCQNVYFDKDFKYIFYVSGEKLYCYKGGTSEEVGTFGEIEAVSMAYAG